MRLFACALLAATWLTAHAAASENEQRIALVIGNAAYKVPAWKLENPVRDAQLVASRLTALRFDVDLVLDATKATMDESFQRFGARLKAAGRDAVAVVFYAGHGAESDGANFLIPVDANVRNKDELRYQAPPVQFLLDDMARLGNAVNILVLDACRDMPLPDGARGLGRGGLAAMTETPNVLIAYATAPNTTAADGRGRNSPFTTAFAAALESQPQDPVSLLFEDVQIRVHQHTQGRQRPRFTNGLGVARWSFAAPGSSASVKPQGTELTAIRSLLAPVSLAGDTPSKGLQDDFARSAQDSVFFQFGEAVLRAEAQIALDTQAKWLLAHPEVRARIYGNADEREGDALELGAQRAKAVRDYLLGAGVSSEQVGSTTYGLDLPFSRTSDEASWALNRRVQTKLVAVSRK